MIALTQWYMSLKVEGSLRKANLHGNLDSLRGEDLCGKRCTTVSLPLVPGVVGKDGNAWCLSWRRDHSINHLHEQGEKLARTVSIS